MNDTRKIAALAPLVARVRTDVTAKLSVGADGKKRVVWTNAALDSDALSKHCNGGPARGVALIKPGESVTLVACLDFDSHKGEVAWPEMSVRAGRVYDALGLAWGMSPLAVRSTGGRGVHIWLMWDEPQDAYTVRSWLGDVLAGCDLRAGVGSLASGQVEVFPKQNEVAIGGYGNQVFLPLAGASEPLEFDDLSEMLVPISVEAMAWQASPGVGLRERPARPVAGPLDLGEVSGRLAALRAPLDAIRNGLDGSESLGYDDWLRVVHALHHESGGSAEGEAAALAWSARSPKHDDAMVEKAWHHADAGREGGVTGASIRHLARAHGWLDPTEMPNADDFGVVGPGATARAGGTGIEGGGSGGVDSAGVSEADEWPVLVRTKTGEVLPTVDNAVKAVRRPDLVGVRIGHDLFRDELMVEKWRGPAAEVGSGAAADRPAWRTMNDPDLVRLRIALERMRFKSVPKELARDAAVLVADEHQFDSAQMWLRSLPPWDGVRRVEGFLSERWGVTDGPYARAVSRYIWTALAGRIIDPGCQADMAVIFQGEQGLQKTSGVAAMAPSRESFVELDFGKDEAELARLMRGALVGEISELRGLHTKDHEGIKSFVSRRFEKWTPKYKEFATTFPRRCVLFGTTNPAGVLSDDTGNRRWLPVHVERVDVAAIERDREQLWAEGAAMFDGVDGARGDGARGVDWREAEALAAGVHAEYMVEDEWATPIAAWLAARGDFEMVGAGSGPQTADDGSAGRGSTPFTTYEVLVGAVGLTGREVNMMTTKRAALLLKAAGYAKVNQRDKTGVQRKVWVRFDAQAPVLPLLPLATALLPLGECDLT